MTIPSGPARKVAYSLAVAEELKKLHQLALKRGQGQAFAKALTEIFTSLRTRPLPPDESPNVFGELRYRLKHLGLFKCVATVRPLVVQFGVAEASPGEDLPIVYISKFMLLTKS
jgi:hypothetical protein